MGIAGVIPNPIQLETKANNGSRNTIAETEVDIFYHGRTDNRSDEEKKGRGGNGILEFIINKGVKKRNFVVGAICKSDCPFSDSLLLVGLGLAS